MNNPIKLSRGNAKIEKALIWNLPAGITCPGATKMCDESCYAKDSAIRFPNVVPQARSRNLEIAKSPEFKNLMIQKLKRSRLPSMRIHESGDFFNQKYLNDWVAIIKQDPERTFWAYTKSWKLNFTEALKLPNLYLRYSVDATTKKYPKQDLPRTAVSAVREDFFICPSTKVAGHSIKCMKDCSFCVKNHKSVTFLPHGRGAKKIKKLETEKIKLKLKGS